jgi:hypothetical protein
MKMDMITNTQRKTQKRHKNKNTNKNKNEYGGFNVLESWRMSKR